MLGCGQGATISLALMVMVLRSANQHEAMALSGMAQGVGYLIAAVGPTLLGALYDIAHNWSLPLAVLLGAARPAGVRRLSRGPGPARYRPGWRRTGHLSSPQPAAEPGWYVAVHPPRRDGGGSPSRKACREQMVRDALVGHGPEETADSRGSDGGVQG